MLKKYSKLKNESQLRLTRLVEKAIVARWAVGYDPPAEKFQELLEKMIGGIETFKSLSADFTKNPKDIATIFKLAQKWSDRYNDAKSQEKYKELLALDPDGKMGTTEYQKERESPGSWGLGRKRLSGHIRGRILDRVRALPGSKKGWV